MAHGLHFAWGGRQTEEVRPYRVNEQPRVGDLLDDWSQSPDGLATVVRIFGLPQSAQDRQDGVGRFRITAEHP